MELPSLVLIGYNVLRSLGDLMNSKGIKKGGVIAAGRNVWSRYGHILKEVLENEGNKTSWIPVDNSTYEDVQKVEKEAQKKKANFIIGFGGGKSIDVAKLAAYKLRIPLISIPTNTAHDGIASPFASIRGLNKPYSITTKPPLIVVADLKLILKAPQRLISSGVGDIVAKLTAVRDWELGRDEKGEYFGEYSAKLALLSAKHVIEKAEMIGRMEVSGVRSLIEALISAGVAAGIAGSSRPCSGAEHLFSHALDVIAPDKGLHGEKVGIGAIMMAKLHKINWKEIKETLAKSKAPTSAYDIGLSKEEVIKALLLAPKLRPERYTILHKVKLDIRKAYDLASSVGVV